jgi:hypothetical protein
MATVTQRRFEWLLEELSMQEVEFTTIPELWALVQVRMKEEGDDGASWDESALWSAVVDCNTIDILVGEDQQALRPAQLPHDQKVVVRVPNKNFFWRYIGLSESTFAALTTPHYEVFCVHTQLVSVKIFLLFLFFWRSFVSAAGAPVYL